MSHIRFKDKYGQNVQTSFTMLEHSELDTIVATAFPMPSDDNQLDSSVPELITEEIDLYIDYISQNNDMWSLVKTHNDFQKKQKKLLLHVEGLNVFDGSGEQWGFLESWIEKGLRSVGTHWNIQNQLGGGTNQPDVHLTNLGSEVITFLEKEKLIFDMAHMGRCSFFDAAQLVKRPLYVSHGNSDVICPSLRNYTDEQLSVIAQSDGVIGVFFPNTFVVGKDVAGELQDVITHILYFKNVMGCKHIAIGSDFGGIVTGTVSGFTAVPDVANLWLALESSGFTSNEIESIAYSNALRVLTSHLS